MMAAATILFFGAFMPGLPAAALTPLALASVVAGGGIAAMHTKLVLDNILECPAGITSELLDKLQAQGYAADIDIALTVPAESLVVFAILLVLLVCDLFHQRLYIPQGLGAILIGGSLAALCLNPAATPPPPSPTAAYTTPLDGCRKVFNEKTAEEKTSPE